MKIECLSQYGKELSSDSPHLPCRSPSGSDCSQLQGPLVYALLDIDVLTDIEHPIPFSSLISPSLHIVNLHMAAPRPLFYLQNDNIGTADINERKPNTTIYNNSSDQQTNTIYDMFPYPNPYGRRGRPNHRPSMFPPGMMPTYPNMMPRHPGMEGFSGIGGQPD